MPYYSKKNILFIHIPKTGGTTLENLLSIDDIQELFTKKKNQNDLLPCPYDKISLQHQLLETIYKYKKLCSIKFDDNLKIIAIVRNPYKRIVSDLFHFSLINKNSTQSEVYDIIKEYLDREDLDNHNIPQYKFVLDDNNNLANNIKVFKNERLDKDNFEINKFLKCRLNLKIKRNKNRHEVNEKYYLSYLNRQSIEMINNFFKKDFELFKYNMM